jgi:hypothetical protein
MSSKRHTSVFYDSEEILGNDSDEDDNVDLDPDWQKTPIFKRIQKLKVPHLFSVHVSLL